MKPLSSGTDSSTSTVDMGFCSEHKHTNLLSKPKVLFKKTAELDAVANTAVQRRATATAVDTDKPPGACGLCMSG
jgi:hypothetical protein